jgi:hypothetical protein
MHMEIYEELKRAARGQTVIYYGQIAPLADLDMNRPDHRVEIGRILDEISSHEHSLGHPLLSAVVVHAPGWEDSGQPGKGFFELAKRLGLQKGEDNVTFFAHELVRVHQAWKS